MPYDLITDYNLSQGIHIMFVYVNDITKGIFMDGVLLSILLIIAFGAYGIQKKTTGFGDLPASFTVSSFATLIFAVLMRLITVPTGSMPLTSGRGLAILLVATLMSFIWLLSSNA